MRFDGILDEIAKTADENIPNSAHDYFDDEGFLCCGSCGTRKEKIPDGYPKKVKILCRCAAEKREREKSFQEHERMVEFRKSRCFSHRQLMNNCFVNDNGCQPLLDGLRKYCDDFECVLRENKGLLFWGDVGSGKSYAACCVANAFCEKEIAVRFANLAEVINDLTAKDANKNEIIRNLTNVPLLILDDFGIQRDTAYANEQIFNLIDNRQRSGKTLIVTTNLTLDELKNPSSTEQRRIYDRILAMCQPVRFSTPNGKSLRQSGRDEKRKKYERYFGK